MSEVVVVQSLVPERMEIQKNSTISFALNATTSSLDRRKADPHRCKNTVD
jgi:hypothetical protein